MAYDGAGLSLIAQTIGGVSARWEYLTTDSPATVSGAAYFSDAVARGLALGDEVRIVNSSTGVEMARSNVTTMSSTAATVTLKSGVVDTFTVALAASATTDGMTITITAKDASNNTVAQVVPVEVWISESSAGVGLTADSYSGTVTAGTGSIHTALTAKKHFLGVTAATGIMVMTAVDSANPTDQYVAVRRPNGTGVVVSSASGTNWEGA